MRPWGAWSWRAWLSSSVFQDAGGVLLELDADFRPGLIGDRARTAVLVTHDEVFAAVELHVIVRVGAEIDDVGERASDRALGRIQHKVGMLGRNDQRDVAGRTKPFRIARGDLAVARE